MTGPRTYAATFAVNTYALDVSVTGHGSVEVNPNLPAYDHGTIVSLAAIPDAGHAFVGWSGDAGGTTNPLDVTMDAAKAITAIFTHTVTVSAVGGGTVSREPDQTGYAPGDLVKLTAVPDPGHTFAAWSGSVTGTANPESLVVSGDASVTATFTADAYTLDVSVVGDGAVTRSPDQPTYTWGTVVRLVATPDPGHHFTGWSGDTTTTADTLLITVRGNRSYTATFAIDTYALGVTVVGGGSVARNPDLPSYPFGAVVTLTATPDSGYVFAGWSGDTTSADTVIALVMKGPRAVTATFQDADGPKVAVLSPNGGETLMEGMYTILEWSASDPSGVIWVSLHISYTGRNGPYQEIATLLPNSGSYQWLVSGAITDSAYLRVRARDAIGHDQADTSDTAFRIQLPPASAGDPGITAFAIESVAPNPTANGTAITFTLPVEARVRLSVVDVQGRVVAILADGVQPAGRFVTRWSGDGPAGRLGAGVYFLRYDTPQRTFTRRLVIAR